MDEENHKNKPPVLTIDGPGGVGKGAVSMALAKKLAWHYLDSGLHYRFFAWLSMQYQDDLPQLLARFEALTFTTKLDHEHRVELWYDGNEISEGLREESCGQKASELSRLPEVRAALLQKQRSCAKWPGLVTDGRDMGTVVFPEASIKVFLDANCDVRAERRYKQLKEKGKDAKLSHILSEMLARDDRDRSRKHAPLKPAKEAYVIDTTKLSMQEVIQLIEQHVAHKLNHD